MIRSTISTGVLVLLAAVLICNTVALGGTRSDTLPTAAGPLEITLLGHGSLMLSFGGKTIYVDPWSMQADYSKLPKADLILVTHHHRDHLDPVALDKVITKRTMMVMSKKCAELAGDTVKAQIIMANGDVKTVAGLRIEAVPAYNLVHMRSPGQPYHPKGVGNGYVILFGNKRVYVAGDTENTPEMKALKKIDVAFLPMNLPYTMDSTMAADAAKAFKPKILYPYHTLFSSEDQVAGFLKLMQGVPGIEIRVSK
jgi:L-ascorbate metabolism protein UlaG (beta-lactamase superfamily)